VSIPPFGRGFFKAWIKAPGYPSAWLCPRRARFRFARQDHCSSTTSFGLNFRMACDTARINPHFEFGSTLYLTIACNAGSILWL